MIATDATATRAGSDTRQEDQTSRGDQRQVQGGAAQTSSSTPQQNVGDSERLVSVAAGAILALAGIARRSTAGLVGAGVGAALIYRGATGHCSMYEKMGIDTAHDSGKSPEEEIDERGIQIATSFLIYKSPEELYGFWRNFGNLPSIMTHLKSVTVQDDRRSHWVVKAPKLAGGEVSWDAEVTADEPNRRIAWRSVQGSQVDTTGEITFGKYMGDRGTEVHVKMSYVPPAGKLGHYLTSMLGENPKRLVREDLRNFKRLMEIGEILTIEGQSHGTCTGRGKRTHESEWKPLFS